MLLEIKELEKSYGQRSVVALEHWVLYRGDKVALVGVNGSGKTTLLHMISGEIEPDNGRVTVRGSVGVIPQYYRHDGGDMDARMAGRLGLNCAYVHSGGEQTKAGIARAMASGADILLADEPTTNLDLGGILALEKMLKGTTAGSCWYRMTAIFYRQCVRPCWRSNLASVRCTAAGMRIIFVRRRWSKRRIRQSISSILPSVTV